MNKEQGKCFVMEEFYLTNVENKIKKLSFGKYYSDNCFNMKSSLNAKFCDWKYDEKLSFT